MRRHRGGGPLRTAELAEAALLADLAVGLRLFGRLIPVAWLFIVAAILPFAVLAVRRRPRAVVISTVVATLLAFLVGGTGLAVTVLPLGALGLAIGTAIRRDWGLARTIAVAAVWVGVPAAGASVGVLALFGNLRRLTLDQTQVSWHGTAKILRRIQLDPVASAGDDAVRWLLTHWWITAPVAVMAATLVTAAVARGVAIPVVRRIAMAGGPAGVDRSPDLSPPAPVPVAFDDVRYRYPDGDRDAVAGITVEIPARALVAVVGDNGSGKSTLARLLTGVAPTSGTVRRPGGAGFGAHGGTALVAQRPESQVLGVRVAEDVRWGLPPSVEVDVAGLLDTVGLAGFDDRETSTLSGGQLQRLAIAAALAREPALLVCDEATSMLDPAGRQEVLEVLTRLVADGLTVVHITHRPEEAQRADLVVRLEHGRVTARGTPAEVLASSGASTSAPTSASTSSPASPRPPRPRPPRPTEPLLHFDDVGHVYAAGTPWAHLALVDVDLDVHPGEGVVVVGDNGSGKSTLVWLAAGLLQPTRGTVTFAGQAGHTAVGQVGVAFQHARLQLFRPTVGADVAYGLPAGRDGVAPALAAVDLDPIATAPRHVDALSGGQQRRVALAGLLARRPRLVVLDEPLAGLDEPGRDRLIGLLARLRHDGVATVVVTHDHDAADQLGERLVRLIAGRIAHDGALAGVGRP